MGGYNPTVALGVQPQLIAGGNQINPLDAIRTMTDVQKTQNDIQIQRNTIAARNGLSDLIASTPPDQLAARLQASPYSAWVPEIAETYAHMQLMHSQTELAGAETERAQAQTGQIGQQVGDTALSSFGKFLPMLINADPSKRQELISNFKSAALANTPQGQQASAGQAINSVVNGLMVGVDDSPGSVAIMNRNIYGLSNRFGYTPDNMAVLSGGSYHFGTDGRIFYQPFGTSTMDPMAPSGGLGTISPMTPVGEGGGALGTAAPPPMGTGPGSLGQQPPAVAPTVPAPQPQPQPVPQAQPPATAPQVQSPVVQPPASSQAPVRGPVNASGPNVTAPVLGPNGIPYATSDGLPLYTGNLAGRAKAAPANINPTTNTATYDPGIQRQIDAANTRFADIDGPRFDQQQLTLAQTQQIRAATSNLSQIGGLATPGAHLDQRMRLINGYNTLRTMLGDKSETPELSAEASFTELQKQISNLASSMISQNYPGSREAVAYLNNALRTVPGINNTAMSIQLLNRTIEAVAQRQGDEYRYIQDWGDANHGNILDARAAFASDHPINQMMDKVLSEFGIGPRGWAGATGAETANNIKNAYGNHLITWDQASDALSGKPMRQMQEGQ